MEKISGILPSSPRMTNVDLRNSGTARSGAPSFGRPVGGSLYMNAQPSQTTAERAVSEFNELQNIRSNHSDNVKIDIVNQIASDFFGKSAKPADLNPLGEDIVRITEEELLNMPELGAYLDIEA